ncbi:MAG TPA: hypothetical protein VJ777_05820 [Mycobacterium sp.]|nr:hypothetical protein [Mycobacterium sp.]
MGLLLGGAGTGLAMADTGDSAGGTEGGATASGAAETNSDGSPGSESKPDNDPPTSTFGSGREDEERKPAEEQQEEKKPAPGIGHWPRFKHSISIPVLRVPTPEEVAATGWPDPSVFFGTVEVPVPTIDGFFSALTQPEPTPTPGPAFRGQEEAPVIDVGGGGGGGQAMASDNGGPPVLELPLVAVPAVPIPGFRVPAMPLGTSAAGGSPQAVGTSTAAAGAKAPVIRGSLSSGAERPSTSMSPMSGQAAPAGYPRFLRSPTVGELAAVALPGVGGLLFLTFSGGVIGYRQANSSRYLRTAGAERFLE